MIFLFNAHLNAINRIRKLPNGLVATVSDDNKAKIWNVSLLCTNWTLILTYTGHSGDLNDLEYVYVFLLADFL
jgi:WD40 repeat protein